MKKIWCGTISVMLIVAMLINLLPVNVLAIANSSEIEVSEMPTIQEQIPDTDMLENEQITENRKAYIVEEDTSKRSEFYKEFVLSNGLRLATVYPDSVHYEDNGQWNEIDNTLTTKIVDGQSVYTNTSGLWDVRFPQRLTASNSISITKDGYTVSFGMAGEMCSSGDLVVASMGNELGDTSTVLYPISTTIDSIAQVQQMDTAAAKDNAEYAETIPDKLHSRLIYPSVYTNTNIVYDLQGNRVKESVILQSYNSGLIGYRYTLNTGGLIPVLNEDQHINLYSPDTNDIVMVMPAPFMLDANAEYSEDISVSLVQNGNTYILSYYLPLEWLKAEDRAWPVILDPIINADNEYTNIQDITVVENGAESNYHERLKCGYRPTDGIYRFYLRYKTLPALSSSNVIVEAKIKLIKNTNSTLSAPIEVHKVLAPWDARQMNWSNKPDYHYAVEDIVVVEDAAEYVWDVTDIAFGWYSDTENTLANNTGMLFKATDELEAAQENNWQQFCSSDYGSNIPILTIKYVDTNGLESYWDTTSTSAGRAGTGYVQNYSGNLTWVHNDIGFDGNRMPVSISHIYNSNDAVDGGNLYGIGIGWRTNFNQFISISNGVCTWEDGDGTVHEFISTSSTTYKDNEGLGLTLSVLGSGYALTDKQGNKSIFDARGRLTSQVNNQSAEGASSITISYLSADSDLIFEILDGVGRKYVFTYGSDGLLDNISYYGSNTVSESNRIMIISFEHVNSNLTTITYKDGSRSTFGYTTKNLLSSVTDNNGYKISYSYNTLSAGMPSRVVSVTESHNGQTGGQMTIAYSYNRTVITDYDQNTLTNFFNVWGNTTSIQDSEGITTFFQYATDINTLATKHRLIKASQPQSTVINLLNDTGFESGTDWTLISSNDITCSIVENASFHGKKSLCFDLDHSAGITVATNGTYSVAVGESVTFSAYLKTISAGVCIRIKDDVPASYPVESERLDGIGNWIRLEVTYTNTSASTRNITLDVFLIGPGTVYMDCVQLEKSQNASRYNYVENSDFSKITEGVPDSWTLYPSGEYIPTLSTEGNAPTLGSNCIQIDGNRDNKQCVWQTIPVYGSAGDRFVFSGWACGDALPATDENRAFRLMLMFTYQDGSYSETYAYADFNLHQPDGQWQYIAGSATAEHDYKYVTIRAEHSYNSNTVCFDGLQLFREEFGEEYTYTDGNITTVRDSLGQETTYVYDVRNDLVEIIPPADPATNPSTGPIMKTINAYDSVHKLTKSEKGYAAYNEETEKWDWVPLETDNYEYDQYGNITKHTSTANGVTKTTSSAYTSDGNFLSTATDAAGNTTKYGYDLNKSTLAWVQHPEDTETTRTMYTYDEMFRLKGTTTTTDQGKKMSAAYTYDGDMLTQITTPSTAYTFDSPLFGLRKSVAIGSTALATYYYTHDEANEDKIDQDKLLKRLDYGNGDEVKYYYDDLGRLTQEVYYEDGTSTVNRTVTYTYDNSGVLATTEDSKTGYTTKYYYDSIGRSVGWRKTSSNFTHSLRCSYDNKGRIEQVTETYKPTSATTRERIVASYKYDELRNRLEAVSFEDGVREAYEYDDFDRITRKAVQHNSSEVLTEEITYDNSNDHITKLDLGTLGIYWYTYDANGNILSVTKGGKATTYIYDTANQLIRENNQEAQKTWTWTYDESGNITSKKEYAYTTDKTLGTPTKTITYDYGNAEWGDLLTKYNGTAITYDAIGNPLNDGTWNYIWSQGRQLTRIYNDSTNWYFHYDANGMRYQRHSGGNVYTYLYNGSQLSRMTYRSNVMWFTYSADGSPLTVDYNGTTYYYVTNLQGDVVGIVDSSGTLQVSYQYDAWGKLLDMVDNTDDDLGLYNPLRYRGYVYDRETGLYYLQSRYYNPTWGRFINADSLIDASAGLAGNNMFAYCANNPIVYADSSGHWVETVFDLFSLGVSVVEVVINPADPWAWAGLAGDALDLIPFVTGLGEGIKGMRVVAKGADLLDDTLDTIRFTKAVDFTDDALDTIKTLDKVGDFTQSTASAGRRIHKGYKALQEGKEYAKIPGIRIDCFDGANVFELKPYNKRALHQGVNQLIRYRNKIDHPVSLVLEFY